MDNKKFSVFVTKYALTKGIYSCDVEQNDCAPGMVTERGVGYPQHFHGEGKDWHRTLLGAVDRANEMKANKVISLRKQIARVEKLEFAP